MELGIRPTADSPLSTRLAMLTALRLLVLTIFLGLTATLYLGGLPVGGFSSRVAAFALAAAYGAAFMYAVLLRRGKSLPTVALAQLVTDQVTWTVFVYITGGASSGGTSLYGLTCLSGAILLGLRGATVAAVSGASAYALLCVGFVTGLLPAPVDQPAEAYVTHWAEVRYPLIVNLLAIAVVTFLASYLAERLRATGGRLAQATARFPGEAGFYNLMAVVAIADGNDLRAAKDHLSRAVQLDPDSETYRKNLADLERRASRS